MREKNMKTIAEVKDFYGPQLAEAALKLGAIKLRVEHPFIRSPGRAVTGCRFIMTTVSFLQFRSTGN